MTEQFNPQLHEEFVEYVQSRAQLFLEEAREFLPQVPKDTTIIVDNVWLIPSMASGGYTLTSTEIAVAFDPAFPAAPEENEAALRATVFREACHIAQGFNGENKQYTPVEQAVNEGVATVFEMQRAGSKPGWGELPDDINEWVVDVLKLPLDYDINQWKFMDYEKNRQWTMYRAGTHIVQEALKHNSEFEIEDLVEMEAEKIVQLAQL